GGYYALEFQIQVDKWVVGDHPMWVGSDYNFYPNLYYLEPDGPVWRRYVETLTSDAALSIAEAPTAGDCTGPDCPVASGEGFEVDFLGFRAELEPYQE
ncbi:MAG: hypothetical protein JRF63_16200, partial [Deltaproteobacteria bacterium]|nr:hypothetical protein [Deltaproteobacteria bacterium]